MSLFSELTADLLCREIGIPSSSIVLNAAGKFTIVAPNTDKTRKAIVAVETRANEWLMEMSFGENAIGLSFIEASAEDFVHAKFSELWDNLAKNMEKKKCKKIDLECFGGAVSGYLDNFRNDLGHPLCPFCGKRPSAHEVEGSALVGENESACKICRDHIFLGTNLVKKDRLAITSVDADIKGDDTRLLEPIFGYYQVAFVDGGMKDMARAGKLLKYWDISIDPEGRVSKDVTAKFINGYVPTYREEDLNDDRLLAGKKSEAKKQDLINQLNEGAPKTFGHIANKALNVRENGKGFCGIEALGVLKADVDQLGLLMSCGLKPERFTLSRLATLSRQLDWYFTLYLPHLLKTNPQFMDIYTVFAGGDDLFLIGPWNRVIELVGLLRQTFAEYVCHNQEIHFSAGISLHKPHTPLDKLAERAEAALGKSKTVDEGRRNRITLFSETVQWDQYIRLKEIRDILQRWYDKKLINNAMIYRLNDFIRMADTERVILEREEIHLDDMQCLKWHALFDYTAQRNVGKGLKGKEKEEMVREFSKAAVWLKEYGGTLKLAHWNIIYNQRKEA